MLEHGVERISKVVIATVFCHANLMRIQVQRSKRRNSLRWAPSVHQIKYVSLKPLSCDFFVLPETADTREASKTFYVHVDFLKFGLLAAGGRRTHSSCLKPEE